MNLFRQALLGLLVCGAAYASSYIVDYRYLSVAIKAKVTGDDPCLGLEPEEAERVALCERR